MRYYPAAKIAIALQVNTEDGYWEKNQQGHLDFEALRQRISKTVLEFAGAHR
jgi:hypothetical protein